MNELVAQLLPLLPVAAALTTPLLLRGKAGVGEGRMRLADRLNLGTCLITAGLAGALCGISLFGGEVMRQGWVVLDRAGAVMVAVIALVGLLSAFASAGRVTASAPRWAGGRVALLPYWSAFQLFWAALLAVPLARSLILAWLLIEATTAVSALLVAFNGRQRALEAGWKYLVLTTFGLAVALLGAITLYGALVSGGAEKGLSTLNWENIAGGAAAIPEEVALAATVMIVVGLAAKVGWAPLHFWLPDAHSEAPAPISALLSAALLPAVALVIWRLVEAEGATAVAESARNLILVFGLLSLVVSVPFLWRSLPWKRLLAYSSLEHMGVLGLAIGFGGPLATAGLLIHICGHALAKSLGFYAAIPLLGRDPGAGLEPLRGLPAASPALAAAVGVSLAGLAALPPSPLFISEVLIVAGGLEVGRTVWAAAAALLLALGFLGLAHALIEALAGSGEHRRWRARRGELMLWGLTLSCGLGLVALTALGLAVPASDLAADLMAGVRP